VVIPVVDLRAETAGPDLDGALRQLGFVELTGHGLDPVALSGLRSACDLFFDLSGATKPTYVEPDPLANRGFRPKGSEALAFSLGDSTPPDLFESFNSGPDDRVTDGTELIRQTPWPDDTVPSFRPAAIAYLAEMARISSEIDHILGSCIGIPDLADRSRLGPDTMACIDYRPGPNGSEEAESGQQRMGAHSDYTTFTVLHADSVAGLQIIDTNGKWIDVVPTPGSLLMNVGDLLAIWTNDVWPSTLHRVVPMSGGAAPRRRSIAYFHYPDLAVVVEPLDDFVTASRPARYDPVVVSDHLRGKLAAPKNQTSPTTALTIADRPH